MPDMKRYSLAAEQAHGLIDAAYRGGYEEEARWSRGTASHAMRNGYAMWVEVELRNAALYYHPMAPRIRFCSLYPARARKYLADHSIREDEPT